jgi:cytochrome P450
VSLPFIGSFKSLLDYEREHHPSNHPLIGWNKHTYFPNSNAPTFTGILFGDKVCLLVNRPEALEEMLVTKNKFYDKHPSSSAIVKIATGDSIVFAQSDLKWSARRKVMASALYKEKLRDMIEIIKRVTVETLESKWLSRRDTNTGTVRLDIV